MSATEILGICILAMVAVIVMFLAHSITLHRRIDILERDSHTHGAPSTAGVGILISGGGLSFVDEQLEQVARTTEPCDAHPHDEILSCINGFTLSEYLRRRIFPSNSPSPLPAGSHVNADVRPHQ